MSKRRDPYFKNNRRILARVLFDISSGLPKKEIIDLFIYALENCNCLSPDDTAKDLLDTNSLRQYNYILNDAYCIYKQELKGN